MGGSIQQVKDAVLAARPQASWSYQREEEKGNQRSGRGERKGNNLDLGSLFGAVSLGAVTTAFQRESGRGESQSHSGPSLSSH